MCCKNVIDRKPIFAIYKYKEMKHMKVQKKCRGI